MALYRILKYLAFAIGAFGIILLIWLFIKGEDEFKASPDLQESILNPFLYLTYFTLGLTVLAVVGFVLRGLVTGENIKGTLISVGAFIVVFLISFFAASGEAITYPNGASISASGAKWMNTGVNLFYILGVVAVIALLVSSMKKLTFRN